MGIDSVALNSNFSTIDWVIVGVYLVGTAAIGLYANRFVSNMAGYVVAGRAVRTCLGIATMIGSEMGLVTVMYASQKGFTGGFAAFHIGVVAGVVTVIVGMTGFIVVPLRRMGVMTIPEFYERRFGRGVRIAGGLILALAGILNMGLFLKAGAIFVAGLTGLQSDVELKLVMSALLILVLFYTVLGGMISVIITDYIQFIVLSVGMILACILSVTNLGWAEIDNAVRSVHGDAGFDPFHSEGFGTGYVVWMMFTAGLVSCAVWQTAVMRACSAESEAVVKRLYAWSSIGFLIRFMLPNFLGICAMTYMVARPELRAVFVPEGSVAPPDVTLAAMPIFLSQILPAGMIGLIGAGMLAAFMSTHDSYLLCWSSVLTQDVIAPLRGERLSDRSRIRITRILVATIGLFLLIWSLWYPLNQDLWDYMAVTGAVYFTGAFALLLFGLYWRRASKVGAYLALAGGSTALLGLERFRVLIGADRLGESMNIKFSGESVGLFAASLCLVLMILGSLLFPDRSHAGIAGETSS